jgi:hypothetical protein
LPELRFACSGLREFLMMRNSAKKKADAVQI